MTLRGIIVSDFVILAFILFVIYLLIRGKMYVGYGLIWLSSFIAAALLVTVKPVQARFTTLVGAVFPVSGLTMGAFAFLMLLLIYVSVQITLLGDRVTQLAQQMALRKLDTSSAGSKRAAAYQGGNKDCHIDGFLSETNK